MRDENLEKENEIEEKKIKFLKLKDKNLQLKLNTELKTISEGSI